MKKLNRIISGTNHIRYFQLKVSKSNKEHQHLLLKEIVNFLKSDYIHLYSIDSYIIRTYDYKN